MEICNEINEIKHPIIRESLKFFEIDWPLEITTFSDISNDKINCYYKNALQSGAIGGKLLGAGGSRFLLILVNFEDHNKIKSSLSDLFYMLFRFDQGGTRITYYDQTTFN